jgi:hypothetical protein
MMHRINSNEVKLVSLDAFSLRFVSNPADPPARSRDKAHAEIQDVVDEPCVIVTLEMLERKT